MAVMNNGTIASRSSEAEDKWAMVRSKQSFEAGQGRVGVKVKLVTDAKTTNTWRLIIGVLPASHDCKGPKQWVGAAGSWGYIAGTGGKCHNQTKSLDYGESFTQGDIIGIVLDFGKKTIEFFKNGVSQGIAFDDLAGPVHIGASMTGVGSMLSIASWADLPTWDPACKSPFMLIEEKSGNARNTGCNDKWQSIRSARAFSQGSQAFEVTMVQAPTTPNNWQIIIGVVPEVFDCKGPKQWVGALKSWGYIAGTGGKCHNAPSSEAYGEKFGEGDRIRVQLDFDKGTIEFFKNDVSQGIAFTNLTGPVYAAVSMTAKDAAAALKALD